ncbi:hypothetical protein D3C73_1136440 [compost metagenome]
MAATAAASISSQPGRSGSPKRERRLKAERHGASRAAARLISMACIQSSPFSREKTAPTSRTAKAA